jgi:hypothetical protein
MHGYEMGLSMGLGMGSYMFLVTVLAVLAIATLIKYLRS